MLQKMNISYLLYGSLLIGYLSVIALSIAGTSGIRSGYDSLESVYHHHMMPLTELKNMEYQISQIQYRMEGVIAGSLPTWGSHIHLGMARKEVKNSWAEFSKHTSTLPNEAKVLMAEVERGMAKFETVTNMLDRAYENDDIEAVEDLDSEEWAEVHVTLTNPLDRLSPLVKENAEQVFTSFQKESETALTLLWTITAIMMILTGLVSMYLMRRIEKPLHEVQNAMATVTKGDLTVNLAVKGQDEIGTVAGYFNTMVNALRSSREQLDKDMRTITDLQERLSGEVQMAAQLQRVFLPKEDFELPGLVGTTKLVTSSEVGGDYYDYYVVDNRYAVVILGDVSGHGVASGFLVGIVKSSVSHLSSEGLKDPSEILARLNMVVFDMARESLLMTAFCFVYDAQEGEMHYANAGHQFPYHFKARAAVWEPLELGALPLGKERSTIYPDGRVECHPGDRLFIFTDGVVESEDSDGNEFGYERLEEYLRRHGRASTMKWPDAFFHTIAKFTGKNEFDDDLTVMLLEFGERILARTTTMESGRQTDTVTITERFFEDPDASLSTKISRDSVVFAADDPFFPIMPQIAEQGIRRVLIKNDPLVQEVGWDILVGQSVASPITDLQTLVQQPDTHRELLIHASEDKDFIIQEAVGWLMEELPTNSEEFFGATQLLLDELLENALFAAPRQHHNQQIYPKGSSRTLSGGETVKLNIAVEQGKKVGISVIDEWGTLLPAIFLDRLREHAAGTGLQSGIGGGGIFLIWRMSDYLQVRVHPMQLTEVTVLLDLTRDNNMERDSSFQFFFHVT